MEITLPYELLHHILGVTLAGESTSLPIEDESLDPSYDTSQIVSTKFAFPSLLIPIWTGN